MEQLYLLEVLIERIFFTPTTIDVSKPSDIKIGVLFAHLVNVDIESEDIGGLDIVIDPENRIWSLDLGKSILFPCKSNDLLLTLVQSPLELSLKQNTAPYTVGRVKVTWPRNFLEMVEKSGLNPNDVEPASVCAMYELIDENETHVASLEVLIRLSSYGHSLQTQFQIVPNKSNGEGLPANKYFFRNINTATTFKAETYGEESKQEIPLVAPICGPADKTFFKQDRIRPEDMSTEQLNKILCKNKHCPGAQKFAEYGIGPAATGSGLGTLHGDCDVPISYGLSHTYGNLENYGPYGVYTRPHSLDQPYIPKTEKEEEVKTCKCGNPLRLRGGGGQDDGSDMPPKPMAMCKDLMQSFDKVLSAYKKALGPCGQSICPFAFNVIDESCKKLCFPPPTDSDSVNGTTPRVSTEPNVLSACGTPSCPYSRPQSVEADKTFQAQQLKSACGKPTCPFTKQRLGMTTDDDVMDLQYMTARCKPPPCHSAPVTPSRPLDPIHWDCPEPLPKGPCRNPQCPFKPKELRYTAKGPCGSEQCPFAIPPFCGDTNCPFSPPQPCPNAQPPPPPTCGDPTCPFVSPPPAPACDPAQCPPSPCFTTCIMPCCTNATCPANPPTCGDAFCPLNLPARPCPGSSAGGRAPSAGRPFTPRKPSPCFIPENQADLCDNPQCPFQSSAPDNNSVCANPDCSYNKNSPSFDSICPNPDCPYRDGNAAKMQAKDSVCSNPECPFGVHSECVNGDIPTAFPCEIELGGATIPVELDNHRRSSRKASLGAGDDGTAIPQRFSNNTPIPSSDVAKPTRRMRGKRRKANYVYKLGDLYPGVNVGHRECIIPGRNVPAKMGWAWNIDVPCVGLKPRRGWRPGAVARTIAARIIAHRKERGLTPLPLGSGMGREGRRRPKSQYDSDTDASVAPKPTLQIKKRDGTYMITMNPLKDPKTIEDNENPYMECSPLQFKITKNKEKDDSRSCYCEDVESTSSSDSELDIEFTPPAGIIRPERLKRKKNVVHTDTQYNTEDFDPKPKGGAAKGGAGGKKGAKGNKGKKGKKK
ncbi:hypothetical protein PPYR_14725 [Photinus pyralis]|uniref:DUF4776 domain-containing protein n=1 Tax=Photinus pyralis TaxID=7054 RepID=A0A5N4A603_PHOPY|nr:uncharacterized protein LOC116181387 [Photinus pyralis]KAB0792766.1 hypothetical protein PPYR_14725 [Photinus pyralis]